MTILKLKNIKNIIFDLDETLYNDQDVKLEADINVINFFSGRVPGVDINKHYNLFKQSDEEKINDWFYSFLNNFKINADALAHLSKKGEEIYWKAMSRLEPYVDAVHFLNEVKSNYKLGILSDGSKDKQLNKIKILGLSEYFNSNYVVFSEDVGEKKPSERMFDAITERMQINPAESIYIGDRVDRDVLGGNRAGYTTVLLRRNRSYNIQINTAEEKPDIEITTFFDLLEKL